MAHTLQLAVKKVFKSH